MKLIQGLLIFGLIGGFYFYFSFFKSDIRNRSILILMGLTGALVTLFPNFLTHLAALVGVGRGTDLLLYFFIVATFFSVLVLYSKISKLERHQTRLVRSQAISLAKRMDTPTVHDDI